MVAPILTRLYTPSEFGVFALFTAVVFSAIILTTLRLEMGIILPKKSTDAYNLVQIIFFSSTLIIGLSIVCYGIIGHRYIDLIATKGILNYIYLIPIAIFFHGINQAFYYLNNRNGDFKAMAVSKVLRSGSTGITQVLFSFFQWSSGGLIFGFIVSLLLTFVYHIRVLRIKFQHFFKFFSIKKSKKNLTRYKNFPLVLMPSSFIESLSTYMPIFILGYLYDARVAGLFALTQRIIQLPISVIATSVADVLRKKLTEEFQNNGNCRGLIVKSMQRLAIVGVVLAAFLYFCSKFIFGFVFGPEWEEAGRYVQLMAIMIFARLTVNPIGVVFIITEKQHLDLYIQIFTLIAAFCGLLIGKYYYQSVDYSIVFFAFAYVIKFILEGIFAIIISGESIKKQSLC